MQPTDNNVVAMDMVSVTADMVAVAADIATVTLIVDNPMTSYQA